MEDKSQIINLCPVCYDQDKRTFMEGDEKSKTGKCAIHGVISLKYFNEIFVQGRFKLKS
jgi:hypothetical protein